MSKQTVFVLGAGASNEAELPTGKGLKDRIREILHLSAKTRSLGGDLDVLDALYLDQEKKSPKNPYDIDSYMKACFHIRQAMPLAMSIDSFIDTHRGDREIELCGKLAIVSAILEAERKSTLYTGNDPPCSELSYGVLEDTWFTAFAQLLTENCLIENVPERFKKISLIIFNYDRCVEHFLFHYLQPCYSIGPEKSVELLKNLRVFHPYGTVGRLPWATPDRSVAFGEEIHPARLLELASQIKTFAEGTNPESSEIFAIRKTIAEAEVLVFLGFAFHPMNMDLLSSPASPTTERPRFSCIATGHGISQSDCEVIKDSLSNLTGNEPRRTLIRNDLLCNQLFKEYWRSLSFV